MNRTRWERERIELPVYGPANYWQNHLIHPCQTSPNLLV